MMKTIFLCSFLICAFSVHAQGPITLINRSLNFNKLRLVPSTTLSSTDPAGRTVIRSTVSFYISEFEVSNQEYRAFVEYVRDSIAHSMLSHFQTDGSSIDWKKKIDWKDKRLEKLWVQENWGRAALDTELFVYRFEDQSVPVYPDTLVWLRDFEYSYNEPLVKNYFANKKYDRYPVVGVNYLQALAFCHWKTKYLRSVGNADARVSLPSAAEWEAAAAIGNKSFIQLLFQKGKYNINGGRVMDSDSFLVKDYADDGFYYTSPVNSYHPNSIGLYNMLGNVSEWVLHDSSNVYPIHNSGFIAKGGGWDSTPSRLMPSFNRYLNAGSAHSFVGFRYVLHFTSSR